MEKMKIVTLLLLWFICGLTKAQFGQSYPDSEAIVFPGPTNARSAKLETSNTGNGLTVKQAKSINSINSVEDFLIYIGVSRDQYDVLIGSRFGEIGERSNADIPTPANCMPELQSVSFGKDDGDRSIIYFPSCTRIKRCGGCCSHALLSCQPTATILRNFIVYVTKINPDGRLTHREKQVMVLEEHTACECDCTTKPEDCVGKQKYIEDECTCECSNVDEEEKCRKFFETKLWDPAKCTCSCRNPQDCSSDGSEYDSNTCRCQDRRLFDSRRRSGYQVPGTSRPRDSSVPFIVPLDNNKRRQNKDDPEYK